MLVLNDALFSLPHLIDKWHIDNQSMIVFIKQKTKALNVQSPGSYVLCTQWIQYTVSNVGRMLCKDDASSAIYVQFINDSHSTTPLYKPITH